MKWYHIVLGIGAIGLVAAAAGSKKEEASNLESAPPKTDPKERLEVLAQTSTVDDVAPRFAREYQGLWEEMMAEIGPALDQTAVGGV